MFLYVEYDLAMEAHRFYDMEEQKENGYNDTAQFREYRVVCTL